MGSDGEPLPGSFYDTGVGGCVIRIDGKNGCGELVVI